MSMINPAMEARKERLNLIKKMLDEIVPISFQKALGVVMANTGASEKIAREYLRTVMSFYGFKIDNDTNTIVKA